MDGQKNHGVRLLLVARARIITYDSHCLDNEHANVVERARATRVQALVLVAQVLHQVHSVLVQVVSVQVLVVIRARVSRVQALVPQRNR